MTLQQLGPVSNASAPELIRNSIDPNILLYSIAAKQK